MKKIFIAVIIILVAAAIIGLISNNFGEQFDKALAGREVCIDWEMVNLRVDHCTNSDVIVELQQGDTVTLTGKSFDYFGGEGNAEESWNQVETSDGQTGWIVTESIQW